MLKHVDDPDMPWLGFLLGQTPSSIWYWCADQVSVNERVGGPLLWGLGVSGPKDFSTGLRNYSVAVHFFMISAFIGGKPFYYRND